MSKPVKILWKLRDKPSQLTFAAGPEEPICAVFLEPDPQTSDHQIVFMDQDTGYADAIVPMVNRTSPSIGEALRVAESVICDYYNLPSVEQIEAGHERAKVALEAKRVREETPPFIPGTFTGIIGL